MGDNYETLKARRDNLKFILEKHKYMKGKRSYETVKKKFDDTVQQIKTIFRDKYNAK